MKRIFLSLVLLTICVSNLLSQQVALSPVPQSAVWGKKAFDNNTIYRIINKANADIDAVNLLKAKLNITTTASTGVVEIIIGERDDIAVQSVKEEIPTVKEGYYLSVAPNKVIIAGNDSVGTYYGVQTLLQIVASPEVMSVVIKDYPSVTNRGVVEGFYGNPFSHDDRLRQFEFYGKNKMNSYIYSPKDDPYHRKKWDIPYPAAQAAKIQELIQKAHANKVQFVWAIHLGGQGVTNTKQYQKVIDKFEAMYNLGVRHFGIFYDDFGSENAMTQCTTTNYIVENFVQKKSDVERIIFCPSGYNQSWATESYITTLGNNMNALVDIMWTGKSVVRMIDKATMDWINPRIKRNAYIWYNYPVTDYVIDHLLMGPLVGNGQNIASQLSGFTANPMEYAEASKVALYSIADYTWNMPAFNPQTSWEKALKAIMPENAAAFKIFCENCVDLGHTGHGLRMPNESLPFKSKSVPFMAAYKAGIYVPNKANEVKQQFQTFIDATATLNAATSNPHLIKEIKPWLDVFSIMGQKGQLLIDMYNAINTNNPEIFIEKFLVLKELEKEQKSIISRNYPESIKSPNPKPANEVVAPFISELQTKLISEYRKKFNYRLDVLPKLLLKDGRYFVKVNGKYLTNKMGSKNPILVAKRDNVNPQRQEWNIVQDAISGRYSLKSAQDSRYVNELGNFGTNPYETIWHTYNLFKKNGKYAIQNAGKAGDKFWKIENNRIQKSDNNQQTNDVFLFEIIPL